MIQLHRIRKLLFMCYLFFCFAEQGHADNANPLLLPLGEQEALMGNAGIALSGSPANAIYNPAGIADISGNRLTVSGSTYALVKANIDAGGTERNFSSFTTVPNMVVGAKRLEKWTVTYGLFSPVALEIDADFKMSVPAISANARQIYSSKTEEQYIGMGSARKLTKGWSVGVSLFGHRYHQNSKRSTYITPTVPPAPGTPSITTMDKVEIEVISILAILGVQKVASKVFQWGLRISLPGIPVFDQSTVYSEGNQFDGTTLTNSSLDEKDRGAEYKVPLDVGVGTIWKVSARHHVTTDASVQWASSYETIPGSIKGTKIKLGTTLRANLGYQYQLYERTKILTGINWCPSTMRKSTSNETGEDDAPYHFLSVTGGLYHQEKNVVSGVGGFFAKSRTDRNFFGSTPDNNTSITAFGLMLSSSINY